MRKKKIQSKLQTSIQETKAISNTALMLHLQLNHWVQKGWGDSIWAEGILLLLFSTPLELLGAQPQHWFVHPAELWDKWIGQNPREVLGTNLRVLCWCSEPKGLSPGPFGSQASRPAELQLRANKPCNRYTKPRARFAFPVGELVLQMGEAAPVSPGQSRAVLSLTDTFCTHSVL